MTYASTLGGPELFRGLCVSSPEGTMIGCRAAAIYRRFKHHFLTEKEKPPRAIKVLEGYPPMRAWHQLA